MASSAVTMSAAHPSEDMPFEDVREAEPHELDMSLNDLVASIPAGPLPLLPRKSSRRRLQQLNTQDLHAQSSSPFPEDDTHRALDNAIEEWAIPEKSHRRISTYSSIGSSPIEAGSSTEPRSSMSSRTTWNDPLPEYKDAHPQTVTYEKRASTVMSDTDKELLKAGYPDEDEDDIKLTRSLSLYSQREGGPEMDVTLPAEGSKTLYIHARGNPSINIPLPSNELEIQIANPDGTVAYISSRSKRSSADASLSKPGFGEFVRTTYGRRTTLTCRRAKASPVPFTISGSRLQRKQSFNLPGSDAGELEWRYANAMVNGERQERLVLVQKNPPLQISAPTFTPAPAPVAVAAELDKAKRLTVARRLSRSFSNAKVPSETGGQRPSTSSGVLVKKDKGKAPEVAPRVLAHLTRSDLSLQGQSRSSRKPSKRAGMGGELVLEPGCTDVVPEEVIVATALVMMKREQDRLRIVQAAVIVIVLL